MAIGIIIHVTVGNEKRTELFTDERIRFGADEVSDLQIHSPKFSETGLLLEIEYDQDIYRITKFNEKLKLTINGKPIRRYAAIADGDVIEIPGTDISFSFFSIASKSSLITTRQEQPHIAQFIEQAQSARQFRRNATTPKRFYASLCVNYHVRSAGRQN